MIAERRMATLRDLGSDPSVARTEQQMLDFAADQLARNPYDLPFTLTYLFGDDGDAQLAGVSGIAHGHPAAPEILPSGGVSVWPVEKPAHGEPELIELDAGSLDLPTGAWHEPPTQARGAAFAAGRRATRVPGSRAEPAPPTRRRLPRLRRAGGRAHRSGRGQRTQLPGPAAACRGAGRTRPGQDHVLLQRQPRVPHPSHVDPRTGRRTAAPGRPGSTSRRARNWSSFTATVCGWPSWSTRCWTFRASRQGECRPTSSPPTCHPSPPNWPASSGRRSTGPA